MWRRITSVSCHHFHFSDNIWFKLHFPRTNQLAALTINTWKDGCSRTFYSMYSSSGAIFRINYIHSDFSVVKFKELRFKWDHVMIVIKRMVEQLPFYFAYIIFSLSLYLIHFNSTLLIPEWKFNCLKLIYNLQ